MGKSLEFVKERIASGQCNGMENNKYESIDNFIKKHNGNKHILKDCIRDRNGNYHDDIIYEIVNE